MSLAQQTPRGQGGKGRQALAQIRFEAIDDARRRRALLVGRRLQPFGDVGPDGLSVDADLPGDGADRQALAMQIQDHDEFPKFDHRVLPPASRRSLGDSVRPPAIPGMPGMAGSHENWGNFKCHKWGEYGRHSQRAGADRKLTSNEEALLVATACSSPPEGRARWTLELLAGAMVKLTDHDSLSRETVRRRLAENHLKPWQKDMWCIPKVDAEYVARMEDVLDLYAEQPDPKRPVVCFDESPTQLIGEARQPISAAPGRLERFDYEYRRNGVVNLFVFLDAHRSWRRVKVTGHRTADDFALCMRELVDVDFPEAERIRVVLDNLSTHTAAALYAAFPPAEARRVLRRLDFHYTPKHASWLNMVEIEIGVLKGQCLDRRIESCVRLVAEIDVWQSQRNQSGVRNQLDVLHRQGQNQNGARLSRSLAQKVIISVRNY